MWFNLSSHHVKSVVDENSDATSDFCTTKLYLSRALLQKEAASTDALTAANV
jgi:hypothetical protein